MQESTGAASVRSESVFGDYTLVRPIADGGMASVYLARLKRGEFAKWVAVKLIHPKYTGDERFERMFLSEARIVAHVDHPNVCSVFDFGRVDGQAFLAMEYLRGQTVLRVIKTALSANIVIPPVFWARVIADAAHGLHAAHEARNESGRPLNLVHRDISPHNLMVLYSGVTKVLDFGIAKTAEPEESDLTAMDELKGKLSYMSPEQMRREPLDRRSDVFALGATLWEATCGKPLFRRGNKGDTVLAVLQDPVPPPSAVVDDYPPELEEVVMRALARDPEERWASAADLAHELESFIRISEEPCGQRDVSRVMDRLFHDEIESSHSDLEQIATRAEKLSPDVSGISRPDVPTAETLPGRPRLGRAQIAIVMAIVIVAAAVGFAVRDSDTPTDNEVVAGPRVASPPGRELVLPSEPQPPGASATLDPLPPTPPPEPSANPASAASRGSAEPDAQEAPVPDDRVGIRIGTPVAGQARPPPAPPAPRRAHSADTPQPRNRPSRLNELHLPF